MASKARTAGELLRASARAVYGQGIGLPVGAAILLVALTYPVLDSYGSQVLTGVTAILAFGLVCAVDDPAAGILAATPYSPTRRSLCRITAAVAVLVPVWLAAAAVVAVRADGLSMRMLGLEALTLWTLAVAVALGVGRASSSVAPSYVATPVLLGVILAAGNLPPGWEMFDAQPWGPPWIAAQLRWLAALLTASAVAAMLLRDPLDRQPPGAANHPAPAAPLAAAAGVR